MINRFLFVLFALSLSSNAFGAPPVITGLSAGTPTANSIPLSWSIASGGPATAYELRYSTSPLEAGSFASAVPLGGVPTPTGGTESHTVSGLACGTRYWFAVKAFDASGATAVSNAVSAGTSACLPSFAGAGNYGLPGTPHASTGGDFNNDGKPDLAFVIFSYDGNNYVSVLLGNGDGTFQNAVNYGTGTGAGTYFLATGDFNGDGRLDLVAANWLAGNISIFMGNGDGTFDDAVNSSLALGASSVATGDFNGDGKPDLAVTLQDQSQLRIFPGNGDGTFGSATTYSTDHPMMVIVRDFNGDGKEDLAVTNRAAATVSIRLGNGDGTFQNAATFGTGPEPLGIIAQDINRDGKLDLLISSGEVDGSVYILQGNGNGSFLPYTTHQGGDPASRYVTISDLNGDGIADLIDSGTGVYISVGNNDGTFKPAVNFSAGTGPVRTVVIGDYNGDGKPDLATANYGGNNASILLNNSAWSPAGNFAPAVTYASGGTGTHRLTGASFERNGKIDLVITNHWSGNVSKLKGNSDGTFGTAVNYGAGNSPFDVIAGDYSRDGVTDLAVVNHWGHDISVLNGQGDGSFQSAVNYGVGTVPTSIASGDFNADGITDFAVTNRDSNNVSILIGQADGSYQAAINYVIGASYHHVVTTDLDGNGTLDLALSNAGDDTLSILLGNGNGTFQTAVNYGSGGDYPREVVAGDFNGDGKPDLAVVHQESNNVAVLIGTGGGAFASAATYPVGENPVPLSVADINRDGKLDLIAGNYDDNSVSVLYGKGDGTFNSAQTFPVATPHGLFVGDFNSDGKPDISAASWDINGVSVLLNAAPLPTVPQQGLMALWRAENNPLDSIGGNHGTLQNGATYAAGRYGQAFSLDGVDDFMEIPNSPSLNPSSAITVEAWYRPVSFAGNGNNAIVSKGYIDHIAPHYEYHLGVNGDQYSSENSRPGSFSFSVSPDNSRVYVETAANLWVPGNWYHLVGTYDGTEIRLYVNGVLQASAPATGTMYDYGMSVRIGAFNNISSSIDYTPGLIDEVAIHNRALAATEIAAISAMAPNPFSFTPQTGMPLSKPIVSNPITVTGITNATAISITGGAYAVSTDGGSTWGGWTGAAGTVSLNDQVKVSLTSSATPLSQTDANLTIGGVSGTFSVTTAAVTDPNASGLVAWWRAENNAYDSVGGNHGTLRNGATFAAAVEGEAFSFDGEDDYVDTGSAISIKGLSRRSIQAWVKVNSFNGKNQPVFVETIAGYGQHEDVPVRLQLVIRPDGSIEISGRDSDEFPSGVKHFARSAAGVVTADMFIHIAGVYDGISGEHKVFVNGVDATASTEAGGAFPDTEPTVNPRIGNDTTDSFNGIIDELHVYNRALSAIEVSKLAGTLPDPFTFTTVTGAARLATVESESVTVTGLSHPAGISISGGDYRINGSGWTNTPDTLNSGDSVMVRLSTSAGFSTTTTATLTIGGMDGTFSATTLADTEKPVVTAFSIAATESTTVSVDVASFTATDNDEVSGYMITTSNTPPLATDPGWIVTAPTAFTLTTAGTNNLLAWAKDPAGNVSDPATATVTLMPVRRDPAPYNYYDSISAACSAASGGETVKALAVSVPGSVTVSGNALTIKGGHADGYGSQPGVTTIQGTLTIGTGSLTVDRVAVR
jgi:hypothetical protein